MVQLPGCPRLILHTELSSFTERRCTVCLILLKPYSLALMSALTLLISVTFENPLRSVKGIGPVFSAGLIAEIGDIKRFPDDNALANYAGLTWRFSKSGRNQLAEDTFMTRTGDAYLRYYITESANLVRQLVPEYIVYYQQKFNESKTHKHRRALVFTARKLVRLVFALLRDNKNYSPNNRRCI